VLDIPVREGSGEIVGKTATEDLLDFCALVLKRGIGRHAALKTGISAALSLDYGTIIGGRDEVKNPPLPNARTKQSSLIPAQFKIPK